MMFGDVFSGNSDSLQSLKIKLDQLEKRQRKLERQRLRLAFSKKRKEELESLAVQIAGIRRKIQNIEKHARKGNIGPQAKVVHAQMNRVAQRMGKMQGGSQPAAESSTSEAASTTTDAALPAIDTPWYQRPTTYVGLGLALVAGIALYQSRKPNKRRETANA